MTDIDLRDLAAVLFDMDGTLVTSDAAVERAWVAWAAEYGVDRARLGAAGIRPPVLVTTDDIAASKPDPAGYLRAAELLGVPIGRCLVVEDADVGIAAGRAAGAWTAGLRELDADLRLGSLAELARLLSPADRPGTRR